VGGGAEGTEEVQVALCAIPEIYGWEGECEGDKEMGLFCE
jgi:hypothetical protein